MGTHENCGPNDPPQYQTLPILATAILFAIFMLLLKRRSGQRECIDANQIVNTQLQNESIQDRCIGSITTDPVAQPNSPPKIESTEVQDEQSPCDNADTGDVSCWICLEDGPDESGQPLVRDCSCRGESSGFGHLSCLAYYAEQKSEQWDGRDLNKFVEPWKVCHYCHQDYQNELAVDLAAEFVTFVKRKYPDNQWKHLEALRVKLVALQGMALKPKQKEEAEQIASKMLSMIGEMKTSNPSLSKRTLMIEAVVYNMLGCISLQTGTKESAKSAVDIFEKYRDISKAIGYAGGVSAAESNIALVKSKLGVGSNVSNEESLEKQQELYKQMIEKSRGESTETIQVGISLARNLWRANRAIEAERLLTKLAATSKQVHGQHHRLTKTAALGLRMCKERKV